MTHTATKMAFAEIPTDFNEMVRRLYPLRPIHDEVDYGNVSNILDVLAVNRARLNKDQADFLETLTTLVEAYDKKHVFVRRSRMTPLAALKFLLEENNMTASDLGRLLGHRTLGSPILRGKRKLSMAHIKKLAARFRVDPSLFI